MLATGSDPRTSLRSVDDRHMTTSSLCTNVVIANDHYLARPSVDDAALATDALPRTAAAALAVAVVARSACVGT